MTLSLPISKLSLRSDARAVDEAAVAAIASSIAQIGLLSPIRVRTAGDGWEVIAGAHRLAACKSLGLVEIPAEIVDDDDLHAELAMIDENLCRAELSPSDRARQTARRKAIYLELHPETKLGENQHTRVRQVGEGSDIADRFTAETSKATGTSERSVQRAAERGEKVIPEVLDLIRGTRLDTGTYLDKLKRLPPDDQLAAAKRDLDFDRKQAEAREQLPQSVKDRDAARKAATKKPPTDGIGPWPAEIPEDVRARALELWRDDEAESGPVIIARAILEGRGDYDTLAARIAELEKFEEMRVLYEQGGFDKVVSELEEQVRIHKTRAATESQLKVANLRSMETWKKRAIEAGWTDPRYIDVPEGAQ